jgi:hypothetical protein
MPIWYTFPVLVCLDQEKSGNPETKWIGNFFFWTAAGKKAGEVKWVIVVRTPRIYYHGFRPMHENENEYSKEFSTLFEKVFNAAY